MAGFESLDFSFQRQQEDAEKNHITPVPVTFSSCGNLEQEEILATWRSSGFALVDNLLPQELILEAKSDLISLAESRPDSIKEDFGGFPFPFTSQALNSIALHPRILSLARMALGGDVQMTQAEGWLKRPTPILNKLSNQDQRMHMDWPNHTLLHPPPWHDPEVLAMIVYLDDVSECGGPTAVVAREGDDDPFYQAPYTNMPGVGRHEWINDRRTAEAYFHENDPDIYTFRQELYKKEKYVRYTVGTVLLYRLDLWHRGTPLLPEGRARAVINLGYKKAGHSWVTCWEAGWATQAYDNLWGLIPTLNDDQRSALGIPRSADAWWDKDGNRANVQARYQGQKQQPNPLT